MSPAATTVGELEKKLRRLTPRLNPKDRAAVLAAIEAIHELATRLHAATHVERSAARAVSVPSDLGAGR